MAKRKAVVNVEAMRKELAKRAEENIVAESAGNFISTRGRRFTYKGETLSDELNVIVLGYAQDYAYFDRDFDPDNPHPPACFAVDIIKAADLKPHAKAPNRQNPTCVNCQWNEFGSGRGKGKACKNQYRLALVSSDDVNGDIALIRVSPIGYRGWEAYVNSLHRKYQTTPAGVYTELGFDDEQPDFPVVKAQFMEEIKEADILSTVLEREKEAREMLLEPYYAVDSYEAPGRKRSASRKPGAKVSASKRPTAKKKAMGGKRR